MAGKFADRAYDYFLGQGWAPHQAAALAANAQWESGGSPTVQDPRGEGSLGLYQWRLDRRDALNKFAADRGLSPTDEVTQLQFAQHELTGSEKSAGDRLRAAGDLKSAQDAMMHFLRPAGYTPSNPGGGHAYAQRFNLAAPYVGAEAMSVPIGAGPGANPVMAVGPPPSPPMPEGGLLTQSTDDAPMTPDPQVAVLAAEAKKEEEQRRATNELMKTGMGLLSEGEGKAPQFAMAGGGGIHRPQAEAPGMPDFTKMLAQQRLMRRA
jgi:hypothetical protein